VGHFFAQNKELKMIEPVSTIAIGAKVTEFLVKTFAGKQIGKWLSDRDKKKAFEKALDDALIKVVEAGFSIKGPGALDESFLKSEAVKDELWGKLLDPTVDEKIDYKLLEKVLRDLYPDASLGQREVEAIEFFVDALIDKTLYQPSLHDLINITIQRQQDDRLSLIKKKELIRDYLRAEGQEVKRQLEGDLGKGMRYIEPLIEKKEKKKKREEKRLEEGFPRAERDSFTPIDMNIYFTESSDRKVVVLADSGYGKTTLLRELFVRISKNLEDKPLGTDSTIPIYLTPSQAAECSESTILNKVAMRLMKSGCREGKVRKFVQDEFHTGRFIFLIDALDQVFNPQNLLGALEGTAFGNNRVVVTTRPNVYEMEKGHLANYIYLRIRKFDESRWEEYLGKPKLDALREIVDEEFLSVPILLRLLVEYWSGETEKTVRVNKRAEL